jgi:hypothetical protein
VLNSSFASYIGCARSRQRHTHITTQRDDKRNIGSDARIKLMQSREKSILSIAVAPTTLFRAITQRYARHRDAQFQCFENARSRRSIVSRARRARIKRTQYRAENGFTEETADAAFFVALSSR